MSMRSATDPWLSFVEPRPRARVRLFCLPYAGSGAAAYRCWPANLPDWIEVGLVQLPGRETRLSEPAFDRVDPLVQALAQGLERHFDKPFAFFGHSMGALVGFELVRQLRKNGRPGPIHLFVSGHAAPQLPVEYPTARPTTEAEFLDQLRRFGGTPPEILENEELMQILLPVLRADFAVCETYAYTQEPPLDCSLTAFGGLQDPTVTKARLEPWREQTNSSFRLRMFPGDHFYLHPNQVLLCQVVARDLWSLLGP